MAAQPSLFEMFSGAPHAVRSACDRLFGPKPGECAAGCANEHARDDAPRSTYLCWKCDRNFCWDCFMSHRDE